MFKPTFSFVACATLVASLEARDLTLDPILVSASKTEQSLKNITSNVEIITAEEIEEQHYTTIAEALNSLPGVSTTNSGGLGTTQTVFMRGMDTNRVLVLINGIRYQDPSNTNGAAFAHLMISDVERIEVIKGAQSGIWGADASAGVINIITSSAQDGSHAGIHLEKGSFDTSKWGGFVSHKTDVYDAKISIDRVMSDSFTAKTLTGQDIEEFENDPYSNTTLNLSGHLRPTSTDTIGIHYTDINALSNYDSTNPNTLQRSDIRTKLYGVTYDKLLNAHTLSLKGNLSKFERSEIDATFGVKVFHGKTKQVEASDKIQYRENDFIMAGIMKESFDVDYVKVAGSTGKKEVTSKAAYLTNFNTFGNLLLTQSLRRDSYSNFEGKTTGKIGAKYLVSQDLSIGGNYGTAYTAPNIIQMLNPWGTTNINLNPENTKSYDVSIEYKNFTATYFDNHVENLIEWSGGMYTNLNGTSTFKGYEFAYQHNLFNSLSLNANYTHLSRFEDEEGDDLARRSKREAKLSFDYYGVEKWHFGLNGQYIGTRYNGANQTGAQTGRYTVANMVINYDLTDAIQLYGKIDNITDKYYQTVDGYATSPRAWYAGIKGSF
jgi:vitamin B12 transporter